MIDPQAPPAPTAPVSSTSTQSPPSPPAQPVLSDIASVAGYVLGVSYPVLALSTGVRGIYQLFFKAAPVTTLGPALSTLAAAVYLAATLGFTIRRPWAWRVGVALLSFELVGAIIVGALSFAMPAVIGHTAWGRFGADYGFFPLFQPLLGLIWLYWPPTIARYGVHPRWQPSFLFASTRTGDAAS
ncbi:MAG: hypothetical protein ABI780_06315 [Ardenticatenales bacterium]